MMASSGEILEVTIRLASGGGGGASCAKVLLNIAGRLLLGGISAILSCTPSWVSVSIVIPGYISVIELFSALKLQPR